MKKFLTHNADILQQLQLIDCEFHLGPNSYCVRIEIWYHLMFLNSARFVTDDIMWQTWLGVASNCTWIWTAYCSVLILTSQLRFWKLSIINRSLLPSLRKLFYC